MDGVINHELIALRKRRGVSAGRRGRGGHRFRAG